MDVLDISNHHGESHYIHVGDWVVTMKFYKALINVPIQKPNHWNIDNLNPVIIN